MDFTKFLGVNFISFLWTICRKILSMPIIGKKKKKIRFPMTTLNCGQLLKIHLSDENNLWESNFNVFVWTTKRKEKNDSFSHKFLKRFTQTHTAHKFARRFLMYGIQRANTAIHQICYRFMLLCSDGLQINVQTIHRTRFNSTFDIHVHMYKVQSFLKIINNIYAKQISVHKLSTSTYYLSFYGLK